MQFDHAFVLPRGLDPAQALSISTRAAADLFSQQLADAGFVEGSSRSHPGQGTCNRRLFLSGVMLECLFVDDEAALDDARGAALALGQRFRDPQASAIGVAFRPDPDATDRLPAATFASTAYHPAYLPDTLHIDVATGLQTAMPLLFHLPFASRAAAPPQDGETRLHPNGASNVTGISLDQPRPLPKSAENALRAAGIRCNTKAAQECLHVRVQDLDSRSELDFRPLFPLRLHA